MRVKQRALTLQCSKRCHQVQPYHLVTHLLRRLCSSTLLGVLEKDKADRT